MPARFRTAGTSPLPAMLCKVHKPLVVLTKHSPHAEHYGFVAYAGAEVFSLGHAAVWAVAAYLLITGVLAELAELTKETTA